MSSELPEWNKNNAVTILFLSKLNNETLFSGTEYSAVASAVRKTANSVTVLHRADVVYNGNKIQNPTISIASEIRRTGLFSRIRYSGEKVEGTGILIGQTITEMGNTTLSDESACFSVPITANGSVPMTFSFVSFENESQLNAGLAAVKEKLTDETVWVGVINKALQEKLKSEFSGGDYRLEIVESNETRETQLVFVLTTLNWLVREHTKTSVGSDSVICLNFKIEAL